MAGRAALSLASWPASTCSRFLVRPFPVLAVAPPALRAVNASADRAVSLRRRHLVLACPAGLRSGLALDQLALPAAHLLPWYSPAVLVSGHPALPRPAPLVILAPASGPPPRGLVEHRPVGVTDILRPDAVSLLRGGPAPGPLRRGRPVGRWRSHVGAGLR